MRVLLETVGKNPVRAIEHLTRIDDHFETVLAAADFGGGRLTAREMANGCGRRVTIAIVEC